MLDTTLGTLVTYNPKGVSADATLDELESIMREIQVRHLPVIDEDEHIIGLVSERDLASFRYRWATTKQPSMVAKNQIVRVEQIMARQVLTVEQFESPEIALRAMVAHAFHSVPVTDNGRLVGMITSSDFLRELSYGNWAGYEEPARLRMNSPGHTVEAEVTLSKVLDMAEKHNQEFVIIVRRNRPLGVLSRTALRQTMCYGRSARELVELQATPVRLALPHLPMLSGETNLGRAAGMMLEHRARALPVVDRSRSLIGMLQEDDILRALVELLDENG